MTHSEEIIAEIKRLNISGIDTEPVVNPTVFMELNLVTCRWRWFVLTCKIEENDILFGGVVIKKGIHSWCYFRLSQLDSQILPLVMVNDFKPLPLMELYERDNL